MKYILLPEEYKLPNPRIDGFRKLKEVGARTFEVFLTAPECFGEFLKSGRLPDGFETELEAVLGELKTRWPNYALAVRRAYVVPGIENPPGPRFNALSEKAEIISAIEEIFRFAVSQNYHQDEESQIIAFFHPWIGPEKFDKQKPEVSFISYGGYAISQDGTSGGVEVYAVYGMNEGVQSLVADRYLVEAKEFKYLLISKEVPQKDKMICPTKEAQAEVVPVPVDLQFEQVLYDNEILEVAQVVNRLSRKYGHQRVEFSVNKEGMFFIEAADYWNETVTGNESFQVTGDIIEIASSADLQKIARIPPEELSSGKKIIFVNEEIVAQRNYDILGAIAAWGSRLIVLYPGVAATQHAMRILADKGHRAFLVGTQRYKEGDSVKITIAGGKVRITNLSRVEAQEVISLWDASLFGNELCGGKANRLSLMKIAGFQVPHGSIVSTVVFDELLDSLKISRPLDASLFKAIYEKLGKPSRVFVEKITSLLADYIKSERSFAVRSSATIEDTAKQSMAGMFETYLNVKGGDLPEKIVEVFRSSFGPNIASYLSDHQDLTPNLKMAVVIQEMVSAKAAGVIFGADIRGRNADIVEIEANQGLGEGIVSGEAKEVEQFKFARSEKRILMQKGPEILSQAEKKALFMLSERLRKEFGDIPQDIEWAIDKDGQIWVLQSRDLIY